jgi:hypothetical protein
LVLWWTISSRLRPCDHIKSTLWIPILVSAREIVSLGWSDNVSWWKDDMRHREDGPAVITFDQHEWWVNGIEITDELDEWLKENEYSYPFTTDEQKMMFKLRFC